MVFKKIGILGGMGPEASAHFYYKLLRYCQKKYQAVQDTDYPPMVIYSLPLSGFDESGIIDEKNVLKQLTHGVEILERANCDFVVMPCNTIHWFIDELRKKISIPIISIVEETANKIKQAKYPIIGLLASETTLKLQLYQKMLSKNSIVCLSPTKKDSQHITSLILEIMGGKVKNNTKNKVVSVIKKMEQQLASAIVLGCSELPLAITPKEVNIKVYDSLQILAEAAVDYAINDDPQTVEKSNSTSAKISQEFE